jgi:hypothetical protein
MSTTMNPAVGDADESAGKLILVATDDGGDSAYHVSLTTAIEVAREVPADLLLYDRSAESLLLDPYPYPESMDDSRTLNPQCLRSLGRHYMAKQVEACIQEGVSASGWLPRAIGAKEMARCAEMFGVDAVILPAGLDSPSLLDRIRGNCLHKFCQQLEVPIFLVTADAKLQVVSDAAVTESKAPLAKNIRPAATPQRRSA